jgi:hypothetical protein
MSLEFMRGRGCGRGGLFKGEERAIFLKKRGYKVKE